MIELIIAILTGLAGKVLSEEFNTACPAISKWLVKMSTRSLMRDGERYREEWLAGIEDRQTSLRKLMFAIGICFASIKLRRQAASSKGVEKGQRWRLQLKLYGSNWVDFSWRMTRKLVDKIVRFFDGPG